MYMVVESKGEERVKMAVEERRCICEGLVGCVGLGGGGALRGVEARLDGEDGDVQVRESKLMRAGSTVAS